MANKKVSQLTSKPAVNLTDLFLIADPTSGQAFKTTISDLGTAIGSGVSSVNGLVGAVVLDTDDIQELASPTNRWFTDTRARAALSASSPLAYNSGTGVFSIPQSNGSTNGFLSSADWITFNAKQPALSGTGFVKISGTTISYDNSTYLTTSAAASTYLALAGGTLTGNLNGTSATFTGDLTLSASNPRLYFTDTDNNPDYFISNTDGTFTIYDVTNSTSRFTIGSTGNGTFGGNLTVGQIIRSGGTSSQFLKADGSVDSTAYLPLAGGTLTGALFATSASFSGFVGFGGNTSPLAAIDVTGAGIFSSSVRSSGYYLTGMTAGSGALYYNSGANRVTVANYNANGIVVFEVNAGAYALTLNADLSATFASTLSATGATLTGALSGTSASFNSTLTTTGGTRSIQLVSFASDYNYIRSNGAQLVVGTQDSQDLFIQTNNTTRLTLVGSTGAATFSSSVTAGGTLTSGASGASNGGLDIKRSSDGLTVASYSINTSTSLATLNTAYTFLTFATEGTEKMRISGGNVGIGTTAPNIGGRAGAGTLTVKNGSTYAEIEISGSSSNQGGVLSYYGDTTKYAEITGEWESSNNGMLIFRTRRSGTVTEAIRLTAGGNIFVNQNTQDPAAGNAFFQLTQGNTNWIHSIRNSNTSGGVFGSNIVFSYAPNNTGSAFFAGGDTGAERYRMYANGGLANYQANNVNLSDVRTKKEITPLESYWNKFKALEIVKFKYKDQTHDDFNIGVIAQQVEQVAPEFVEVDGWGETKNDEAPLKSVYSTDLYHASIGVLKEAMVKIETLEAKIATLENK